MNNLFKALNDSTRRQILELLKEKDLTAGEIAAHFNISKPSISHHLDLLKRADLVIGIRQGQFISYSLNMSVFEEVIQWLMQFQGD
jgi:DNA-binding transcriptional ArsR family regulator